MADDSTSITLTQRRKKKFPACDYCKAKRVICHSQQTGSCPRCLEKGIICTTTPVGPRKRRTKAQLELDKAQSNALASPSTSSASPDVHSLDNNHNQLQKTGNVTSLLHDLTIEPGLDIPPELVKELIQEFRVFPHFRHPLVRFVDLESSLNRCSWKLANLPSQHRVLAQCIIAVSARVSLNERIIGSGQPTTDTPTQVVPLKTRPMDCREYGQRREAICEQLRAEAVWLAHREGIMTMTCVSNTVSLALLEFLEYRASGKGGTTYCAAYIHHLRDLSEGDYFQRDPPTQTKYSAFLMLDALTAVTSGKAIPFTHHDELLLCGEEPLSLEQVLGLLSSNSPAPLPIYTVMRPLSLHTIRLARDISESLTGAYARRHPISEAKLVHYLNTLDLLHSGVNIGVRQMEQLEYSATDQRLFYYVQLCAYPLLHGWGSLVYLIFEELTRRRELIRAPLSRLAEEDLSGSVNSTSNYNGETGASNSHPHSHNSRNSYSPQTVNQARLDMFYVQVRAMTSQAALEIARSLKEVPTLSRVSHLNHSNLDKWARFLLEDGDAGAGAELNPAQRVWALQRFRGGLNLNGFSWIDRTATIDAIDEYLATVSLGSGSGLGTMQEYDLNPLISPPTISITIPSSSSMAGSLGSGSGSGADFTAWIQA